MGLVHGSFFLSFVDHWYVFEPAISGLLWCCVVPHASTADMQAMKCCFVFFVGIPERGLTKITCKAHDEEES